MSAVGHYLEEGGIATASISLVREHSEVMQPPRALWVPFMLGRPLGAPNDAAFQRQVLRALLALFEAEQGPVLRDFALDAPTADTAADDGHGDACPVNFARPRQTAVPGVALAAALADEIDELRPWHDLTVRRRGGSSVGLSGLTPEQAGAFLCGFAANQPPDNFRPEQALGQSLKQVCDDLRAYYEEAAAAQPGGLGPAQMQDWFYLQTVAGQVLVAARSLGLAHADKSVRAMAERVLIPRAILNRKPSPQA
ncbi:MAG: hypothetical protein A3E25_16745 [Burkholderiales bacterium RIFCSPHIGHO2_12_FULL_69_20]|nr:MAG: hypothetical protein A3E25_16745 [Burkholderiales bacterium RIFCSPHIGHO2_12_FULL_69_20]